MYIALIISPFICLTILVYFSNFCYDLVLVTFLSQSLQVFMGVAMLLVPCNIVVSFLDA